MRLLLLYLSVVVTVMGADPDQPKVGPTTVVAFPTGYEGTLNIRTQLNIGSSGQAQLKVEGSVLTLTNAPLQVNFNQSGTAVPLRLDNKSSTGDATAIDWNVQGTNTMRLLSASFVTLDNTLGHEWWVQALDKAGSLGLQLLAYSEGDVSIGFQAVRAPSDTNGFLHIPSASGLPTGTPYYFTATHAPIIFNRADNRLWAYNTNWFDVSGQVATMTSSAAIGESILVKFGSDASHVDVCGAANTPIGVALTSTSGASQSIRIMFLCGSVTTMTASGTVTFGSLLEPAASGKAQIMGAGVGTHHAVGRALETKTNAVMRVQSFYFRQEI